ncbi:ATP-binding protein [Nocardioides phosphati]|nr:LuxR C-terminal-related transcriptional regulator [Nocardioides phosphati]
MTEALAVPDPAGQLPAEVTSFVGRRFERSTVRELLSEYRLVTLTGFGGIGKTRLAMRMAAELRRVHPDGVCFVPLGALEVAEEVPDQVAASLGLTGRSPASSPAAIVDYLRERTMLLVLDNCEHVVDAAAVLAETVLRSCPTVRILATSREPLRVEGEVAHAVTPLSLPGGAGAGLQESEAVQLFLDRARASAPGFTLNNENRAAVAAICRKLEGIPLALELAAARLTTLSAYELEQGLTDRWELLSRGRRTAPHRQSTMAACIEWSFDLCTPAERRLWARVAVFVDGFEHDAVRVVCAAPDEAEPLLETLASLVDKSVLTATREGATTRFRMLPPLRQRGLAELERIGEATAVRQRHRDFHLDLVARAHAAWLGADQLGWIDRVRRELGNITEALEQCVADPQATAAGLRACGHLLEYVHILGLFRQGRRWAEHLLAVASDDVDARVRALRAATAWATIQGDLPAATALLAEAEELAGPGYGELQTLLVQAAGLVAQYAGQLEESERLLVEADRRFTRTGELAEAAHCRMLLVITAVLRDQPDRALEFHRSCLALTEPVGEGWVRSWSLWAAGIAEWMRGDTAAGQRMLAQCLRLERAMAERIGIGSVMEAMAWTLAHGDPERAVVLMGATQNEWERVGAAIDALPGFAVRHREAEATARAQLGDVRYDEAHARGRALDQAAAIALCLGERAAPPVAAVPKPVLTRRERQIAELIHQGLTNREIADALVISTRTAEGHVEHILTKLGFTSRTQVAAWVAEQHLAEGRS